MWRCDVQNYERMLLFEHVDVSESGKPNSASVVEAHAFNVDARGILADVSESGKSNSASVIEAHALNFLC